ncbi:hypothetical protein CFH99_24650 [Nocardioides aromaticivorans]|uniref:Uncharacterized protein n=1 Tax=Nocardioides aromaticivorans TaxID=200618 RepID=A0ABX7PSZ4_9ACTN|nr:hypothetical protein [Nocardioides aromaticivorans]QSR28817.1 hypothetical protein CFH99_24650 [Nocardioides aromaticivorans]
MLDSVIAASLGAVVAAAVGSLIVSSDRLRQAASADADLLETLKAENKAIAETVSFSMARAAAVAAIRSIHPTLTLSEAVALAASLLGMPLYIALLDQTYPDWLGITLGSVVAVALVGLYAVTTSQWCRRAYARIARYREAGLPDDAFEAERQTKLAVAAQGVIAAFGFLLTCMMLGTLMGAAPWGELVLAVSAVGAAIGASALPRKRAAADADSSATSGLGQDGEPDAPPHPVN